MHSYSGLLPANILESADEFRNHFGFKLFDDANMAEWANEATQDVYNVNWPHFIIDCSRDRENCQRRKTYIELIDSATGLENALNELVN